MHHNHYNQTHGRVCHHDQPRQHQEQQYLLARQPDCHTHSSILFHLNQGAGLLLHNQYDQAIITFNEAMRIMKDNIQSRRENLNEERDSTNAWGRRWGLRQDLRLLVSLTIPRYEIFRVKWFPARMALMGPCFEPSLQFCHAGKIIDQQLEMVAVGVAVIE